MAYRPMNLPQGIQQQYYRDPRLSLSNRLILEGSSTAPVQHWAQGLGRLAQALAGTYIGNRADQEYRERGDKYANDLSAIMAPQTINASEMDPQGGSRPATMAEMLQRASGVRNPDLGPLVQNLALTAAGQQMEDDRFTRRSNLEDTRWQQRFETEGQRRQRERDEDRAAQADRDARMFGNQMSLARFQVGNRNEPLVAVMGAGGPEYIPQSQAKGRVPYDATAARQATFSTLTPEEVAAAGLPPGSSVQKNNQTGALSVLNKPATAGTVIGYTADGEPITAPGVKAMTEGQANAALYADRIRAAEPIISDPKMMAAQTDLSQRAKSVVPIVGNYLVSEDYQKADQAQRDFINAVLRRESGAVISDQEFDNARRQYFPQPGDSPDVLKQKAANRRIAGEGIARAAGPAYGVMQAQPKSGGWSIQKVQ